MMFACAHIEDRVAMPDHFADREREVRSARRCAPRLMRRPVEIANESLGEPHHNCLGMSRSSLAGARARRARSTRARPAAATRRVGGCPLTWLAADEHFMDAAAPHWLHVLAAEAWR